MGPTSRTESKIAGPSIKVWLNDPNLNAKSEGCRNACAAKNHAVPGIGIEGIDMEVVKTGCSGLPPLPLPTKQRATEERS